MSFDIWQHHLIVDWMELLDMPVYKQVSLGYVYYVLFCSVVFNVTQMFAEDKNIPQRETKHGMLLCLKKWK